jgi:hypothetical protein
MFPCLSRNTFSASPKYKATIVLCCWRWCDSEALLQAVRFLGCGDAIAKRDLGIAFCAVGDGAIAKRCCKQFAVLGMWGCDSEARPRNRFLGMWGVR